ncbi:MAG: cobyric acid synthase [Methylobacteriaceae bacterium]|nr:cobyric acid synthase [Methylobacteriaceae bacterium]
MFQGTGSDVGKSLIVAGLCRAFARRGLQVRPFKPQNMSNNAAVTADGGEIGRAQALQARACGVAPTVDMNPVLLKPQSDIGSQVVVRGRIFANARASEYQALKPKLMGAVLDSFRHLAEAADLVLVEGAGSAAEINLRRNDIANMGFARTADVPVVLIGDIERGGVIAQIVGTRAVLDGADAAMIVGFLVNRFRGDAALFAEGMDLIERRSGWPALGLLPHFARASRLPAEDAVALQRPLVPGDGRVTIAVPLLPHIANFDDFDPLKLEDGVRLVFVPRGEPLPRQADLVILPGSKATMADVTEFRRQGWDIDLAAHVRQGGRVLGICAGYQMLGRRLADPAGIEGPPGTCDGLALLDVETELTADKTLRVVAGTSVADGVPFAGYEMHVGETSGPGCKRPLLAFEDGRVDGAVSADGRIRATHVHGLFSDDRQRAAWLAWLGASASGRSYETEIDAVLDELAAHLVQHIDLDRLLSLSRPR